MITDLERINVALQAAASYTRVPAGSAKGGQFSSRGGKGGSTVKGSTSREPRSQTRTNIAQESVGTSPRGKAITTRGTRDTPRGVSYQRAGVSKGPAGSFTAPPKAPPLSERLGFKPGVNHATAQQVKPGDRIAVGSNTNVTVTRYGRTVEPGRPGSIVLGVSGHTKSEIRLEPTAPVAIHTYDKKPARGR